jgi:hypothetical protein
VQGLAQHCHNAIEKVIHHCQTQRISFRKTEQQLKILSPFFLQKSHIADPAFAFKSTSPTPHLTLAPGEPQCAN